ncbi:Reverse transcriptase [Phytophthora palmivora]|uniref:Reverse transcriptase n=1 Tax=Phytophthora palmivora TaxID=4796 RepID=A0A2P4XVX2_9STRA|nr:Reverse transcriptase [Phytophthora palmivora]
MIPGGDRTSRADYLETKNILIGEVTVTTRGERGVPRKFVSTIVNDSTLNVPCASPIVVIIKTNGIDIRLCINYRLANCLTRLMVYPMSLIND